MLPLIVNFLCVAVLVATPEVFVVVASGFIPVVDTVGTVAPKANSFLCNNNNSNTIIPSQVIAGTALYGRKIKRGSLSELLSNDDEEEITTTTTTREKKTTTSIKTRSRKKAASSKTKKKKGSSNTPSSKAAVISSDLAKFMETVEEEVYFKDDDEVDTSSIENRKKSPSSKKQRQKNQNNVIDVDRSYQIGKTLTKLTKVLEKRSGNVCDILNVVEELLSIDDQFPSLKITSNSNNVLRRLLMNGSVGSSSSNDSRNKTKQARRTDYRLAWVGSDESICHIGTGLHKVPLARMQEVFMNCIGKNQIEVLEVISLLGPFPNVKNILVGKSKLVNTQNYNIEEGDGGIDLQIVMDSMVDGTGKEILAGTEDNIRQVDLRIAFCDERVIVAVVPPPQLSSSNKNSNDEYRNPLDDDGKHMLLFVKENNLSDKLEALRVSSV